MRRKISFVARGVVVLLAGWFAAALAQVPALLHHQGRIAVGDLLFDGVGQFRFAIVNGDATATYWRNAPDADSDGQPDAAVSIPVNRGLYSVLLGDTALPNMAALRPSVFDQPAVFLRVWFDDGVNGPERLVPDQRIASAGYALVAGNVPDGAISAAKLAPDALGSLTAQIAALNAALADLTARHEALAASFASGLPAGVPLVSPDPADAALTSQGYSTFMTVPSPAWANGAAAGAPSARHGHSGVWTGQEWLIWGGSLGAGLFSKTGAGYDPALDRWQALPEVDAPTARRGHSAVWTGDAMLVWGGFGTTYLNSGSEFRPAGLNWTPLATAGAPEARDGHLAVWTGSRMLIWGGFSGAGLLVSGGLYDPVAKSWSALPTTGAPEGRLGAAGVWTGARFVIWGGLGESGELASGGMLPLTGGTTAGAWTPTTTAGAPSARADHTAVWTGERVLFWGGRVGDTPLNSGAAFNPSDNTWTALPTAGAPDPRARHVAVWTGTEMLVFGGETASGPTATGGAYNPATGKWRSLTTAGSPIARSETVAAWSGTELLVFGGRAGSTPLAALQRLNPQPTWYFYRKP
ncbi:MAG: galactose oxidase [Verrucomicrobia bacterium]|nr:galactose oxidase [Verrucomicrobiota bacterium]